MTKLAKQLSGEYTNGVHVVWVSAPNQAYFIMMGDSVLRIISDRTELQEYLKEIGTTKKEKK
jgi:hypothetical protein